MRQSLQSGTNQHSPDTIYFSTIEPSLKIHLVSRKSLQLEDLRPQVAHFHSDTIDVVLVLVCLVVARQLVSQVLFHQSQRALEALIVKSLLKQRTHHLDSNSLRSPSLIE